MNTASNQDMELYFSICTVDVSGIHFIHGHCKIKH